MAVSERAKFEREALVSMDRPPSSSADVTRPTQAVVSLLVAVRGQSEALRRVGGTGDVQKALQASVGTALMQRIQSQPELYNARRLYMLNIDSSGRWLPAASGAFEAMPALRYVLNINYLLLPEMMPRFGLSNFGSHPPLEREQVLARSPVPRVDDLFFAIHVVDGVVFVLMKTPDGEEAYRW
jgi:hypothetical protein